MPNLELHNLDLNLHNYSVREILSLFNLDQSSNTEDLRRAKKLVAEMHPDKSDIDPKFFSFFMKAYIVAERAIRILIGSKCPARASEKPTYDATLDEFAHSEGFLDRFNELFTRHALNKTEGHGGWLAEDTTSRPSKLVLTDRQKEQALVVRKETAVPCQSKASFGADILDQTSSWDDGVGSDVRAAHTSVVVVPEIADEVCRGRPKNLEDARRERYVELEPTPEREAQQKLRSLADSESAAGFQRAIEISELERAASLLRANVEKELKRITLK